MNLSAKLKYYYLFKKVLFHLNNFPYFNYYFIGPWSFDFIISSLQHKNTRKSPFSWNSLWYLSLWTYYTPGFVRGRYVVLVIWSFVRLSHFLVSVYSKTPGRIYFKVSVSLPSIMKMCNSCFIFWCFFILRFPI